MNAVSARWQRWSPAARVITTLVGLVLVVNIGAGTLNRVLGGGPAGPSSSSYATSSGGLAGYADLLAAQGSAVTRLRTPLDQARLDPGDTLVLSDAELTATEAVAVVDFVRAGGRLVAAGPLTTPIVRELADARVRWSADGARASHASSRQPETAGVREVESQGEGSWGFVDNGVLIGAGRTLAFVADAGRGRVVAVADPSILSNGFLDRADNAGFAVAAAGPAGRPVVFAEYGHGYGHRTGTAALPRQWQHFLWIAGLAVALAMWARGKRLGPPDRDDTVRPPPRVAYVEALAATLVRTGDREEGVRPVRSEARALVLARAGLPADAGDDELRRVASAVGLSSATVQSLLQPVQNDDDVVAVGMARASLEGKRW
jgi:hypothetical protein